jgi:hypothetical protein
VGKESVGIKALRGRKRCRVIAGKLPSRRKCDLAKTSQMFGKQELFLKLGGHKSGFPALTGKQARAEYSKGCSQSARY